MQQKPPIANEFLNNAEAATLMAPNTQPQQLERAHRVPPQNEPGAPRRLRRAEKVLMALEYRILGATYREIAQKLDVNVKTAFEYVRECLTKTSMRCRPSVSWLSLAYASRSASILSCSAAR